MKAEILSLKKIAETPCDMLVVYVFEDEKFTYPEIEALDVAMSGRLRAFIEENMEVRKAKSMRIIETLGKIEIKRILIVGMGKSEDFKTGILRSVAAEVARFARGFNTKKLGMVISKELYNDLGKAISNLTEGALLGLYEFEGYKTKKEDNEKKNIENLLFVMTDDKEIDNFNDIMEKSVKLVKNVNMARTLINMPPNELTPKKMAEQAEKVAKEAGLEISVFNKIQMEEMKMGAIVGVARGSEESPKLIVLRYNGLKDKDDWVAYVGKGVMYDSGGLSLKPTGSMVNMKTDMAGAASVLMAMKTIAEFKLPVNIIGVLPCVENMPSGKALRPGEVLKAANGKTIEVLNSDAEGRLILADAVAYAVQNGAKRIVDIATLTGAVSSAIGNLIAGVVTNNDEWCELVMKAGKKAEEWFWRFPVHPDYKEELKSDCADLKNIGTPGVVLGGLFIGEFSEGLPWVHLDIAGVARAEKTKGEIVKGGTGTGIRTLVELAKIL